MRLVYFFNIQSHVILAFLERMINLTYIVICMYVITLLKLIIFCILPNYQAVQNFLEKLVVKCLSNKGTLKRKNNTGLIEGKTL